MTVRLFAACTLALCAAACSRGAVVHTIADSPPVLETAPATAAASAPPPASALASAPTPAPTPAPTTALAATVVKPSELLASVAMRRDTLVSRGQKLRANEVGYYLDIQEARFRQVANNSLLVSRREGRVVLNLSGALTFETGSTKPSARAVEALNSVARVMVEYKFTVIALQGHTDNVGDAATNQRVSEQRALAVANVMIAAGVSPERIVVTGFGAANPIQSNATAEGRNANRRVEIEVSPVYAVSSSGRQ